MLAPFSGTVSRLLVDPAQAVKKGERWPRWSRPIIAAAVSTYRKALVTAQNARKLADLDKDLLAHQGVSHARKPSRPRPMPPAPKPTAMPACRRCNRWAWIRK